MSYRWLVVALTMVMQAVSYGILAYSFALFVVPWLTTFNANRAGVMMAVFVLQIAMGVISPLAGRLFDQHNARGLVVTGGALMALGLWLVAQATQFWQITLLYATLLPIAITLTGPLAAQTIITRWFQDQRGMAIGVSAVGTSIGGFLVPILCGFLLARYDWRITLGQLALLSLVVICPLAWMILKRSPPEPIIPAEVAETPDSDPSTTVQSPQARDWTTREILTTRNFWLPVLALLPLSMAFGGVQFNLAAYAQDLGNSLSQSAWLISVMSLSMIVGKLFFGFMSDRVEHRYLYWIAASLMCLMLLLITNEPGYSMLLTCSALLGLSVGGLLPLMGAIYSHRFGVRSFGRVMGLVTLIITLGGFGPLIAGAVFDATGSYDAAFLFFLALLIPGALGMIWLKKDV
jgi:MFS family permease